MDKMSKEDLMKILAKAAAPKKERKKAERTEEQQKELLERLAKMRENSKIKRNEKAKAKEVIKKEVVNEKIELAISPQPKFQEDIFEKKYGSTFEKMTDILGRLDNHLGDIKDMKKAKRDAKAQAVLSVSAQAQAPAPAPAPIKNEIQNNNYIVSSQAPSKPALTPSPLGVQKTSEQIVVESPNTERKIPNYKNMTFGRKRF
jgi:hypothetical protein